MSTPQPPPGPPAEKDKSKRRSIQRFVTRIIRSNKSKKSETAEPTEPTVIASSSTAAAPTAPPVTAAEIPTDETPASTAPVEGVVSTEPEAEAIAVPESSATPKPAVVNLPTLSLGVRQLVEKYGVEIPEVWPYAERPPPGERVEKPIRMRVRRYCHVCRTAFGSDKSCSSCGHKRCVECPRSPPSKEKKKTKTKYKEFDPYAGLTRPSKTGGQDLVHRKTRQRVHYKCHKCEADFAGQKICPQCSHNRCKKCHREPSRKPKPIEEIRRTKPIKWTCCDCTATSNITKTCLKCAHPRCVDCTREAPKKKKKKAPLITDVGSGTETKEEATTAPSDVDKISSALAAASIS
ncbi:hypothetical protein TWF694_009964 [Orbilia ellipsospora]|uniref:Uncharacterized protein n=1 Tax=Orbilia ellipsospora TaxID=2528407 RepID=A0AAV9XCF1_9PEZI